MPPEDKEQNKKVLCCALAKASLETWNERYDHMSDEGKEMANDAADAFCAEIKAALLSE